MPHLDSKLKEMDPALYYNALHIAKRKGQPLYEYVGKMLKEQVKKDTLELYGGRQ